VQRFDQNSDVVLSASDLTAFLACGRLTQERLRAALGLRGRLPRNTDPHATLAARHGDTHERAQLEVMSAAAGGHATVELPAFGYTLPDLQAAAAQTERLMRDGVALIFQAVVFDGRWQGRVDFLRRVEVPSALGAWAYEVVDTKLARRVKPSVVHQLALYHRLVARIQGDAIDHAVVRLGDGSEEHVDLRRYAALHRRLEARLEAVVAAEPQELAPEPVDHCARCPLSRECHAILRGEDALSFVAGAGRVVRRRLVDDGIETLQQLADLDPADEVKGIDPERLERLRSQAALQAASRESGEPRHDFLAALRERGLARLPARCGGDVFFDFEGDPYVGEHGIEYLWGWTTAEGAYDARWAHDAAAERAALKAFLDWVQARRRRYPDLHVFHYGAHEASKLKSLAQRHGVGEEIVDEWLRSGVLVDLYAVVRQGIQAGEESYSLKRLERHYGFVRREHSVRDGGGSIVAYEAWLETGEPAVLEAIRAYNREDCLSTAALRDWLLDDVRPAAAARLGADFDDLAKPAPEEPPKEPRFLPLLRPVLDALLTGIPPEDADLDDNLRERRLLAHLLLYHYRESKPQYWHWFAMQDLTAFELVDEREAIGLVAPDGTTPIGTEDRSNLWRYRFPPQETKLEPSSLRLPDPTTGKSWKVKSIADDHLLIKVGAAVTSPPEVNALIPPSPPDGGKVREAATEVARAVLDGSDRFPAVRALLRRERSTLDLATVTGEVDDLVRATLALERSYLAVQGPPGTGKTYRAAHMVVAALKAGHRVAVTANSHAAIQNLLRAIEHRAGEAGVLDWAGVYKGEGYESLHGLVDVVERDEQTFGDFQLVAGTAWVMAHAHHRGAFRLLFVDEAGQFSLANAAGAGTVAQGIVLLGDPQQLPQVNQASHPFGAGASVLAHLADGADVLPADRGVLLERSWRMHPAVCRFVSELSYEGRLASTDACARRRIDAPGPLSGAGLRAVAVPHDGCSQASEAEADVIKVLCEQLVSSGATVTDDHGRIRPLTRDDILIVAPYNLARRCLEERLPGFRVGTVDKFQGQEAPVVFFAMTCSSGDDVPRGLDFLFDRNRLNVAVSRAQCLAVLVHSPRLLEADCRTLAQMHLVNGVCRFTELADAVPVVPPVIA
jgi:predicted RecB family nuclease